MNTTADPSATQPGSLTDWLAGHAELGGEALAGLVALIEPLGSLAAIKAVANGRYVFASPGLAQLFEREVVVGHTDAELLKPDETTALRRVEQTVMAQRLPVASEHKLEINGRRREFSVTRLALGQEFLLSVWHERTEERHRAPAAVRCEAAKANSFRRPSTQWGHVGFDPGLVDEDQALWIKTGLPGSPTSSPAGHINAALFKSEQRFF